MTSYGRAGRERRFPVTMSKHDKRCMTRHDNGGGGDGLHLCECIYLSNTPLSIFVMIYLSQIGFSIIFSMHTV